MCTDRQPPKMKLRTPSIHSLPLHDEGRAIPLHVRGPRAFLSSPQLLQPRHWPNTLYHCASEEDLPRYDADPQREMEEEAHLVVELEGQRRLCDRKRDAYEFIAMVA